MQQFESVAVYQSLDITLPFTLKHVQCGMSVALAVCYSNSIGNKDKFIKILNPKWGKNLLDIKMANDIDD